MTAKSDDMAASEFNITRIKEIQAMFPKGEVSFSRLKQSRVRQYLERDLVNCIIPLCPCVYVVLTNTLNVLYINFPCCFSCAEPVCPWEMFHSGRGGDKNMP